MEDKDREIAAESAAAEVSGEPTGNPTSAEKIGVEEERPGNEPPAPEDKRGRLVTAGLAGAVVVSLIAVIVAGIFKLTVGWMAPCPKDLVINDPAPILWNLIAAEKVADQTSGVPPTISLPVTLKSSDAGQEASDSATAGKK